MDRGIQEYREWQKGLYGSYIIPRLKLFNREVFMVISIEHLPEGRAKNALGIQNGNTEGISVHNLVGIVVNADFAADTLDNNKPGQDAFLDHKKVLGKAAKSYIHILMGLGKHIHGNAVMTVELEEINSVDREGFILTGIELHAGLINNEFCVFNKILAQILPGIHPISTGNGDIGIDTNGTLPVLAVYNPVCKTAGKTAAEADHNTLTLGLFGEVGGKGSLAGAGNTEVNI